MSSDCINVCVRIRPVNSKEKVSSKSPSWIWENNTIAQTTPDGSTVPAGTFTFDHIFDPTSTTESLFDDVALPLVLSALEGINSTIIAYGQTSSGKTHTMMGSDDSPGVIPLAVHRIFDHIQSQDVRQFVIRVAYLEIYNDVLSDLGNSNGSAVPKGAPIQEMDVSSAQEVLAFMKSGQERRHVGATDMNDASSRSHTVFRIIIESRAEGSERISQLDLVDLAGSERVSKTGATGERFNEGVNINKSLLALGNVIKALSEGAKYIPYRNAKLTSVLETSLGGNARTAIVCTVTPAGCHVGESLSTLKFANRAKNIQIAPMVNEKLGDKALLRRQEREIQTLRQRIEDGRVDVAEQRIQALSMDVAKTQLERDEAIAQLEEWNEARVESLHAMEEFVRSAVRVAPVPGAEKSGRHARRQSIGHIASTHRPSEGEIQEELVRPHDGHTIDFGAIARQAALEADEFLAAPDSATAHQPPRERDIQLSMLPQRVASEIVALRVALDRMSTSRDTAQREAGDLKSKLEDAARARGAELEDAKLDAAQAHAARESTRRELDALREAHAELQTQLQASALAAADTNAEECEALRDSMMQALAERDAARTEAGELRRLHIAAQRRADDAQRDLDHLGQRFARMDADHVDLTERAAANEQRAAEAERELARQQEQNAQLVEQLETDGSGAAAAQQQHQEQMEAFAARYEELSTRCSAQHVAVHEANCAVSLAEARCDALAEELTDVHEQAAALELERDALLEEKQTHLDTIALLEEELDVAREYAAEYDAQVSLCGEQRTTLDNVRAQLQAAVAEGDRRTEEIVDLQSQLNAASAEAEKTQTREAELARELRRAQGDAKSAHTRADNLQREHEAVTAKARATKRLLSEAQLALECANANAETERERAEQAERRAEELDMGAAAAAVQLQMDQAQKDAAARMKSRHDALNKELLEARDQADAAEARISALESQYAAQAQSLQFRCDTLQQTVLSLEQQLVASQSLVHVEASAAQTDVAAQCEADELRVLVNHLEGRIVGYEKENRKLAAAAAQPATDDNRIADLELKFEEEKSKRQKIQAKLKQVVQRWESTQKELKDLKSTSKKVALGERTNTSSTRV